MDEFKDKDDDDEFSDSDNVKIPLNDLLKEDGTDGKADGGDGDEDENENG